MIANETAFDSSSLEQLFAEIAAYLVAVDAFRSNGVEPHWAPERGPDRRRRREV